MPDYLGVPIPQGTCNLCDELFTKRQMTRHLRSCREKNPPRARGRVKPRREKVFHLVVEGGGLPQYWMHLEAPATATLRNLDALLREVWLECCGHMSAFTIASERYSVSPLAEYGEQGMDLPLGQVLRVGMRFYHEYDFGTTTTLLLRAVSETERLIKNRSIQVLALNVAPEIRCEACGKRATQVCCICVQEGAGWLCDDCVPKHPCEDEVFLPVVNSPRTGMCGYDGH